MKPIKQIADEIGVTPNAILMKIRRNSEFAEQLQEHIDNNKNIDDEGERIIKATIKPRLNIVNNSSDNVLNVISNVLNVTEDVTEVTKAILELKTEIVRLETQLTAYEQRLADKDRQIEELRQLLGEQTRERQAYSAALIAANTKLSEIRHLTLTDRLFGWNNVQTMLLTDSSTVSKQSDDVIDAEVE